MSAEQKQVPGGLVVFFEGLDGVGKTTQLELAVENLRSDDWLVQTTRGHGGTPFGEALRKVSLESIDRQPDTNLYLSMAIHNELGHQVRQWREDGAITLIDRGPLSMAAYQIFGDGCDPEAGWREVAIDIERFDSELLILYTAAIDVARQRSKDRGGKADYFERKPRSYFERIEAGYQESGERFGALAIDAEASIEQVNARTMGAIHSALCAKLQK